MKGICLHNIHILNFLHMNDGMFIQLFRSVNDELVVYESSAGLLVRRQPSLLGLNNWWIVDKCHVWVNIGKEVIPPWRFTSEI